MLEVDPKGFFAADPQHGCGELHSVKDFDDVGVLPHLDDAADEAGRDQVGVSAEVDLAPLATAASSFVNGGTRDGSPIDVPSCRCTVRTTLLSEVRGFQFLGV
jgi:hypothetical protein